MANMKITLTDGIKVGDETLREAELREPTAGDIIDAHEESEKLVQTIDGPRLISSPTLSGANMLRRQIVRIGNLGGPLSLSDLRRLSPRDMDALQTAAAQLEDAALGEVLAARGRGNGSGQASAPTAAGAGQ